MTTSRAETQPILSIAIPTYNRAGLLEGTLSKLCAQAASCQTDIEVIVSDNCSTDGTPQVCAKFTEMYGFVKLIRNQTNIGVEGNVMQIMRQASGEWVWLFGDDDIPHENAVATLIKLIDKAPEELALYLLNYRQVDRDGVTLLSPGVCNAPEDWHGKFSEFFDFCGSFDMLGFISALLIRKRNLDWRNNYEQFCSYYAHIGYLIQSCYRLQVRYRASPILDQRQNNQRSGDAYNDNEKTFSNAIEGFVGMVMVLLTAAQQLGVSMKELERLQSKLGLGNVEHADCVPMLEWAFGCSVRNDLIDLVKNKQLLEAKADLLLKVASHIASPALRRRIETSVSVAVTGALANNALQAAIIALRQV